MGAVAVDADVAIGFLEPTDANHERAVSALSPWLAGRHRRLMPCSVYAEVMTGALRGGVPELADGFVDDGRFELVVVDRALARRAAELRARHRALRMPDALALATALEHGAELLTFDERLARVARRERA